MDTDLLKTFVEVSKTRHFGKAAEALYLTQSAVSSRVRLLENLLGATLFIRSRNNIQLTPAGEKLSPYAEELINTWLKIKNEISQKEHRYNEISIGAPTALWEIYLTDCIDIIFQNRKDITINTVMSPRTFLIQQLLEKHLDLVIAFEPPKMDELNSQVLLSFSLQLYTIEKQFTEEEGLYIKQDWGADLSLHDETALKIGSPILNSSSIHLTHKLLHTTGGCAYLPDFWAAKQQGLIQQPAEPVSRQLYAVWLQTNERKNLIDELLEAFLIRGLPSR